MRRIAEAITDGEIAACFPVMSQLRPKIAEHDFVALVKHLAATNGFQLTAEGSRSKGYGGALFDWLVAVAAQRECRQVRLVSNVRRVDAHRFYQRKGMSLEAHYFSMNVPAGNA